MIVPSRADELDAVLGEGHRVLVGLGRRRLVGRRPDALGLEVAEVDVGAPVVEGRVLAPARDGEIVPPAVAGAGVGQHDRVAAVGQDAAICGAAVCGVSDRRGACGAAIAHIGCRARPPRRGPASRSLRAGCAPGAAARRRAMIGSRVEAAAHRAAEERVGDGDDASCPGGEPCSSRTIATVSPIGTRPGVKSMAS